MTTIPRRPRSRQPALLALLSICLAALALPSCARQPAGPSTFASTAPAYDQPTILDEPAPPLYSLIEESGTAPSDAAITGSSAASSAPATTRRPTTVTQPVINISVPLPSVRPTTTPATTKPVTTKPAAAPTTATAATAPTVKPTTAKTAALEDYAAEVARLVNAERAKQGLPPLAYARDSLTAAAQVRAEELPRSFSHTRPNGSSCFSVLDAYGIDYQGVGENIAYGQINPAEVMDSWMHSTGHRENILGSFDRIGIGVARDADGRLYWSQLFLKDWD
ncbi:MAG: CAP domain-containing protein [Oscillospiraceae bacterium]|jgi:uncharacterized protein YkwD|nr:CAP domain-containing protein [Oscillospiraceae bacterium]